MQTSVRSLPPCFHRTKVGRSQSVAALPGSGKSSALRLIFRFYDPTSGAVFVDGQNIADVTQVSHPIHIAMQLQAIGQKGPDQAQHWIIRPQCIPAIASENGHCVLQRSSLFSIRHRFSPLVGEFASLQNSHQV